MSDEFQPKAVNSQSLLSGSNQNLDISWTEVKSYIPSRSSRWYRFKTWFRWITGRYNIEDLIFDMLQKEIAAEIDKEIIESVKPTKN